MGQLHADPECDRLMRELADALTAYERQLGEAGGSALIFVPIAPDQKIILLANGKLHDGPGDNHHTILGWALGTRKRLAKD